MILPSFTIIRLISSLRGLFIAGLKFNKNSTMIYTVRILLMSHGVIVCVRFVDMAKWSDSYHYTWILKKLPTPPYQSHHFYT